MVVDIQPLAVSAVPDAGLFRLCGAGTALAVDVLCQADVCDAGSIFTNDMDVGVQDGGVYWLAVLRQYWQNIQNHQLHFTTKKEQTPISSNLFCILLTFHWILGYNKNCSCNFPGKIQVILSPITCCSPKELHTYYCQEPPGPFAPISSVKHTHQFFNISDAVSSVIGKYLVITEYCCKGVNNQEIFKLGLHYM